MKIKMFCCFKNKVAPKKESVSYSSSKYSSSLSIYGHSVREEAKQISVLKVQAISRILKEEREAKGKYFS